MSDDYKPRFSFEISEEQQLRANKLLEQYGLRKAIFCKILDNVLDVVESNAGIAIGLLMKEDVITEGIMAILSKNVKEHKKKKGD